jgi:UDP-glucose 4-epimerase
MKNKYPNIVIFGGGFVSSELVKELVKKRLKFSLILRKEIDLSKKENVNKIKKKIKKNDIIFFIAAKVPVKNFQMFEENINILNNLCAALFKKKISKIIYLSSDAVFSDSKKRLHENSLKDPDSLHGLMHIYRERILSYYFKNLSIVRPTLIYGNNDSHNGYGPNLFIRLAQSNKNIKLFGRGEEIRDHVHISDVIKVLIRLIKNDHFTDINVVSSKEISFNEIAHTVKKQYKNIKVTYSKRMGKMPHDGIRIFDNNKLKKIFKIKSLINLKDWIKEKKLYTKI